MKNLLASFVVFLVMLAACGGEAKLGEACGESGKDGECEDGAVCGKESDTSEALRCIRQCNDDTQCASGEACNGVSGTSLKGCRPKTK